MRLGWAPVIAAFLSFLAGCTLFASYDLEGLPCDVSASNPAGECLGPRPDGGLGYVCVRIDAGVGVCRADAGR